MGLQGGRGPKRVAELSERVAAFTGRVAAFSGQVVLNYRNTQPLKIRVRHCSFRFSSINRFCYGGKVFKRA